MTARRKSPLARKWFLAGASTLSLLTPQPFIRGQAPPTDMILPATAGGSHRVVQPYCPPMLVSPYCPIPAQPGSPFGMPGSPDRTGTTPSPDGAGASPTVQLGAEGMGATGTASTAFATPNMMGDLLGAGRSVSFFITRSSGSDFVNAVGSTAIINRKIAENNSPLPRDRISYRYNYFRDASQITGLSNEQFLDDDLFSFRHRPLTRSYDLHLHTLSFEKTFFDGLLSVELRVPFTTGLRSKQFLNYGTIVDEVPARYIGTRDQNYAPVGSIVGDPNDDPSFQFPPLPSDVSPTPRNLPGNQFIVNTNPAETLGRTATEWGDLSLIFKGLLYQDCRWAFSGGTGLGIPTAPDTNITVVDYSGNDYLNNAEFQRTRVFQVNNETWSLAPFLAALWTPTPRLFMQGFVQFDFPLNSSAITYSDTARFVSETAVFVQNDDGSPVEPPNEFPVTGPVSSTDFANYKAELREQILMSVDYGAGYWLYQNPQARWLTGIIPTLELHYTTTLRNADVVVLPKVAGDNQIFHPPGSEPGIIEFKDIPNPTVGNLRNRVDIFNMTLGTTFALGDRATLATAVGFPLLSGDNRTFDWEAQVQFNYYFGGGLRGPRFGAQPVTPAWVEM